MQLIFLQKLLTHDWRQRVILKDERHTSSVSFRSNPYFSGLCSWTKWIYQQWCGREWPINFVCEKFQYLFTWIVQWIILSLSITRICLRRTFSDNPFLKYFSKCFFNSLNLCVADKISRKIFIISSTDL